MAKYESRTSRYRNTPEPEEGLALEDDLFIFPHADDIKVEVTENMRGRPDLVSYAVYKNPLLAWVIMRRNGIMKAEDVKPGTYLWAPTVQRVYEVGGVIEP